MVRPAVELNVPAEAPAPNTGTAVAVCEAQKLAAA
jgi:hypothetical protein